MFPKFKKCCSRPWASEYDVGAGHGAGGWPLHSRADNAKAVSLREELGKNINADEAAAMGAVYQAAALSKAFKVKPFVVRDAVIYPILVSLTW